MPGSTSLPNESTSLPLQVETNQAASSVDDASWTSTPFLWKGVRLAVLMVIGVLACALHPLDLHSSATPSHLVREVAFIPMTMPSSRGGTSPSSPTAFRSAAQPGALRVSLPAMKQSVEWLAVDSEVDFWRRFLGWKPKPDFEDHVPKEPPTELRSLPARKQSLEWQAAESEVDFWRRFFGWSQEGKPRRPT